MEDKIEKTPKETVISEETLKKAEKYVQEEEGAFIHLSNKMEIFITVVAVCMSLFHLYSAVTTMTPQYLRGAHVVLVLSLTFLLFPYRKSRQQVVWFNYVLAALGIIAISYMLIDFEDFIYRSSVPNFWDMLCGVVLILLILEATRRTSGLIMLLVVVAFIVYAMIGPILPSPWTHKGYDISRLVGHLYMTTEGIFGVPIDVSSSFIILFTIYGAFLELSGAGEFFVDVSFAAMGGKPTGAGRTVVLASFLLGGPSGSATATTVTLGSVAYPLLEKSGYGKNQAGGLLAAGGIGAVLSPPVLGAAAFLIAQFLNISYLEVIIMATIPTLLYYWSLFLMVELDAKLTGITTIPFDKTYKLGHLIFLYWYHFVSLIAIIVFMVMGFTPIISVFGAIIAVFALSFIRKDTALYPKRLIEALKKGSLGVLGVATTCAAAGIIVGIVTLTGLGLKFSSIIIAYAHGNILLTAIYSALIVWVIGLAIPVTASYIISAVIVAPALVELGIPDYAAHMFIFYYAVLSEVSPPTALSCFAAAALTGGNPYKTTLYAWRYTIPAFVVPFMFVLDPTGIGLLLKGAIMSGIWVNFTAFLGISILAAGTVGWFFKKARIYERIILVVAGLSLAYGSVVLDTIGICLTVLVIISQYFIKYREV